MSKHDRNGPSVSELSEINRFTPIVKLGRVALWNCFTRKVVDLKAPTIGLIQKYQPEMFQEMLTSPRPVAMGDAKFQY
jgi:hypothetical protein